MEPITLYQSAAYIIRHDQIVPFIMPYYALLNATIVFLITDSALIKSTGVLLFLTRLPLNLYKNEVLVLTAAQKC